MRDAFSGERPLESVVLIFRDGTSRIIEINDNFVEASGFYVHDSEGVPDGTIAVHHALGLIWTESTHGQEV